MCLYYKHLISQYMDTAYYDIINDVWYLVLFNCFAYHIWFITDCMLIAISQIYCPSLYLRLYVK